MDGEVEVPFSAIQNISQSMSGLVAVNPDRQLIEDVTICSRKAIKEGLKTGDIKGSAIVEWSDDQGSLRVNVIEFICDAKLKATDPKTGQVVAVLSKDIPDGAWRLLN